MRYLLLSIVVLLILPPLAAGQQRAQQTTAVLEKIERGITPTGYDSLISQIEDAVAASEKPDFILFDYLEILHAAAGSDGFPPYAARLLLEQESLDAESRFALLVLLARAHIRAGDRQDAELLLSSALAQRETKADGGAPEVMERLLRYMEFTSKSGDTEDSFALVDSVDLKDIDTLLRPVALGGNIFPQVAIADSDSPVFHSLDAHGKIISAPAAERQQFARLYPDGLFLILFDGKLFFPDRVRVYQGESRRLIEAVEIRAAALDGFGNLVCFDEGFGEVFTIDASAVSTNSKALFELEDAEHLEVNPLGQILVLQPGSHSLACFARDGARLWRKRFSLSGRITSLSIDMFGDCWVLDQAARSVHRVPLAGGSVVSYKLPASAGTISSLATDGTGVFYGLNRDEKQIHIFTVKQ